MREFATDRQKAIRNLLDDYNKDKPKEQQITLDVKDIVIFDYIAQMCLSENEKVQQYRMVIDDVEYTYITYKKIIEDNPLLNISAKNKAQVLGSRINKLEKVGLLNKYFSQEKGSKTYYTLSSKGYTLITEKLEGVSSKSDRGSHSEMRGGITEKLDNNNKNNNIKRDKNKKDNKKRMFYIYTALTFFEKKLLILLGNLQKHFETYNLKVNTYKKHLEVFRGLSSKYEEEELITAIYARAIKAIRETSGSQLKTIANPNFLKASMEDLLLEAKEFMEYEELDEDSIETEFYFMADAGTYLNFYSEIDRYSGEFIDKAGNTRDITTLEEDIFLIREYLKQFDIELISGAKSNILHNAIRTNPYESIVGRYFHSLLDEELFSFWNKIKDTDDFVDFHNKQLLKIKEVNYKDLKLHLMEKVSIK